MRTAARPCSSGQIPLLFFDLPPLLVGAFGFGTSFRAVFDWAVLVSADLSVLFDHRSERLEGLRGKKFCFLKRVDSRILLSG